MADTPIYLPPSSVGPWKWGARHYFYNCHREGGDFKWFRDNLSDAETSPEETQITAKWTFANRWNPEESMPPVLPFVFLPRPRNGSYDAQATGTVLKWIPSRNARSHNVYFGRSSKPEFCGNQKENWFDPGRLERSTTYYWRIDEITDIDTTAGPLWHFTTE
jgi:hypothetical protein